MERQWRIWSRVTDCGEKVAEGKARRSFGKYLQLPREEITVVCTRVVAYRWRKGARYRTYAGGREDRMC